MRVRVPPPLRVFIDFDGTLVEPNVAIELVERFAPDGREIAHEIDRKLHHGEMTLREAWEQQASLLRSDQLGAMTDFVVREVPLRAGAHQLLDLLRRERVPVVVVSGGLDFYIRAVLAREGLDLPIRSDVAEARGDGSLRVIHPEGHATCRKCGICKAQVLTQNEERVTRTVFVGDGSTDRFAAEVADIVFARGRLLTYCRNHGIPVFEFETFSPVTANLAGWLSGTATFPEARSRGLSRSECPISQLLANEPKPP